MLYGRRAGILHREAGTLTFTYDEEYLDQRSPTPLSLSMPLSNLPYTKRLVEAHLRGLLPDNDDVRRRWAAHFGLKDRDTFGLVAEVGADATGGALFLPEDTWQEDLARGGEVVPVDEAYVAGRLRRLRGDGAGWLEEGEHWSLAGAQSKFTLRALDLDRRTVDEARSWGLPQGVEPSSHIVKPGVGRIRGQALVEHVSMRAAAALGLLVADTAYVEFEDQPAIVVTRFDRRVRDGALVRVHQEDLCQALGLDPSRKYEADRGPGVARIADLLRALADRGSVEHFARAVIVNYLLGAPDAHAKNYSLLLVGATVRLAPLYDVASGLGSDADDRLRFPKGAMSIGGEREFGRLQRRHWEAFAARCGLPGDLVLDWVRTGAVRVIDSVADAVAAVPATAQDRGVLTERLLPRVAVLAKLTIGGLNKSSAPTRPSGDPGAEIAKALRSADTESGEYAKRSGPRSPLQ